MAKKATRKSFGETIVKLGETNDKIVVLDADLSKSTQSAMFAERFPDRFFEMGIAEANMVGTAAGLSFCGKIPFICSFAVFLTGRFDIIRMSIAYSNANVKIVGTHAGIGIGEDGNSQMGLEDIAIMRTFPNMYVVQPADDLEAIQAVERAVEHNGPVYLRLTRQAVPDVHPEDYRFEFGKATILKDGKDVTLFATGALCASALEAAKELEKDSISARVINISSIQPIDEETIIKAAKETKRALTFEDHTIRGGMGGAVCEVLSEHYPIRVKRVGLDKTFGESGQPEDLYKKYGFDAEGVYKTVRSFLETT